MAKISNIHVNGWFGDFDKSTSCLKFAQKIFGWTKEELRKKATFVGDSPNDEPLFQLFDICFGVANLKEFATDMKHLPTHIANHDEADGFAEIAQHLIKFKD